MAAGVRERLLNGAHQRERDLRGELARGALDDELAAIALLAVRLEQRGKALPQRRRVAAQRSDRASRLLESLARRQLAATDPFERAVDVAALGEQQLGRLELDRQAAEGVSEHVVDLARDPRALIERRGSPARRLGPSRLRDERLGGAAPCDVLATGQPDERAREQDRRIAERLGRRRGSPR